MKTIVFNLILILLLISCSSTTRAKKVNPDTSCAIIGVEVERPPFGGEIFDLYLGRYDSEDNLIEIISSSASGIYDSHCYFINLEPGKYSLIFVVYKAGSSFIFNKSMNDAYIFPPEMIEQTTVNIIGNENLYLGKYKVSKIYINDYPKSKSQNEIYEYVLKNNYRKIGYFSQYYHFTYDLNRFSAETKVIFKNSRYENILNESTCRE